MPARDEQAVLDDCLRSLRAQHDDRGITLRSIVLVDDGSTDATPTIAAAHAAADPRVQVCRIEGPPPGWAGKTSALHAGVGATVGPDDDGWWAFVDADVLLAPDGLARMVATARAEGAEVVSTAGGPAGRRSATWLWLPAALQLMGENADSGDGGRRAFAIGHCLLVRADAFARVGGWSAVADERPEDIALATRVRDAGGRVRVVDGLDVVTTSGMDPHAAGWAAVRKSFGAATDRRVAVLLPGGVGQMALALSPPAAVAVAARSRGRTRAVLGGLGLAGWAAQTAAHDRGAALLRAPRAASPLAPLWGAVVGGALWAAGWQALRGRTSWKGR